MFACVDLLTFRSQNFNFILFFGLMVGQRRIYLLCCMLQGVRNFCYVWAVWVYIGEEGFRKLLYLSFIHVDLTRCCLCIRIRNQCLTQYFKRCKCNQYTYVITFGPSREPTFYFLSVEFCIVFVFTSTVCTFCVPYIRTQLLSLSEYHRRGDRNICGSLPALEPQFDLP